MIDVRIPVADRRLRGKLLVAGDDRLRRPGILFVHGWGSSQRQNAGTAKRLIGLGAVCLTFNLTGHGRSRRDIRRVTRAQNLDDVRGAYDFLARDARVDPDRLGVIASSYGGYLATLLTAERKIRWLALQAPALYKDGDFDRPKGELNLDPDLPAYRRRRLRPEDNVALERASRFEGDVLIVESEHDTVIPHPVIANYVRALGAAASRTHEVIAGADHGLSDRASRAIYGKILQEWFASRSGFRARARVTAEIA